MRALTAILLILSGIALLVAGVTLPNLDTVQVSCTAIAGMMLAGVGLASLID